MSYVKSDSECGWTFDVNTYIVVFIAGNLYFCSYTCMGSCMVAYAIDGFPLPTATSMKCIHVQLLLDVNSINTGARDVIVIEKMHILNAYSQAKCSLHSVRCKQVDHSRDKKRGLLLFEVLVLTESLILPRSRQTH
jgi:hypothetical protein